jgi:hypothetical protein
MQLLPVLSRLSALRSIQSLTFLRPNRRASDFSDLWVLAIAAGFLVCRTYYKPFFGGRKACLAGIAREYINITLTHFRQRY